MTAPGSAAQKFKFAEAVRLLALGLAGKDDADDLTKSEWQAAFDCVSAVLPNDWARDVVEQLRNELFAPGSTS